MGEIQEWVDIIIFLLSGIGMIATISIIDNYTQIMGKDEILIILISIMIIFIFWAGTEPRKPQNLNTQQTENNKEEITKCKKK